MYRKSIEFSLNTFAAQTRFNVLLQTSFFAKTIVEFNVIQQTCIYTLIYCI